MLNLQRQISLTAVEVMVCESNYIAYKYVLNSQLAFKLC